MGELLEYAYKMTGVRVIMFIGEICKPGEFPLVELTECGIKLADLAEHFWGKPDV